MSKIKNLLDKYKQNHGNRQELIAAARAKVNEAVQTIFDELPFVKIISVSGYTPYFNDGDVCKWSIHVAVDWYGYNRSPHGQYLDNCEDDDGEIKLLISEPLPIDNRYNHPNKPQLKDAADLLECLSKEFEIMDDDANGTWWQFTRDGAAFKTETETFEHD